MLAESLPLIFLGGENGGVQYSEQGRQGSEEVPGTIGALGGVLYTP